MLPRPRTAVLRLLLLLLLPAAALPGVPASQPLAGLHCDFESPCAWTWNASAGGEGFRVATAASAGAAGPQADAGNRTDGHFLLVSAAAAAAGAVREWLVLSPQYVATSEHCRLSVALHMAHMQEGNFKVVVSGNNTSWVVSEKAGNDRRRWDSYNVPLGRVSQEFRIILEVVTAGAAGAAPCHVAIDNVRLVDCFPKPPKNGCHDYMFHCDNDTCIERDHVCDIRTDCPEGEDEEASLCELPGAVTRCSFESGWCGWNNTRHQVFSWALHSGASASNYTGPQFDHTFENASGTYLYLNMSQSTLFAEEAVTQSGLYFPPPPCHSNVASPYYKSCKIRFYYHHFGRHNAAIKLILVELDKKQNHRELWRNFKARDNQWYWQVVPIPNVTERYFFRFEARRGMGALGDIALDDISMSPECFGNGLPENETIGAGYKYGFSYWQSKRTHTTKSHDDFENKTYYSLSTCGSKGRFGPSRADCLEAYNGSNTHVNVMTKEPFSGVQKWTAPEDGFYTIIAKGASGGLGSEGNGSSLGARARLIVELHKGQALYILVGQEGFGACWKGVSCPLNSGRTSFGEKFHSHFHFTYGGGGGGGGSFVFKLNENWTEAMPVLVAAGGGGLCEGSVDDGKQHGHGVSPSRKPVSGVEHGMNPKIMGGPGGAGGGWRSGSNSSRNYTGLALLRGGKGGRPCNPNEDGTGGFGGGGSGCNTGGGGGGYAGGHTWFNESAAGEGGHSYVGSGWLGEVLEGTHDGPGEVFIIPAIAGCQCDYRCVALDEFRHSVKCICPENWELAANNISCISTSDATPPPIIIMIAATVAIVILCSFLGALCFFLYNRYQRKKITMARGQMLSGPDLQLNRLREAPDMMTEYNPNYAFAGSTYTIQDLKDIPRDHLRLVKALGQGAFGEVYQGFYRHRAGDAVEMPVAVKTLPELSTNQAETDFLMEALIMSKFNHPNIVHFIGVCFDKHPRFIILELLAGGDLKTFLRESRPKPERPSPLTMKDLLQCAIDVAKGCKYMEDNRFIHRDIAARNCLLTTKGPGRVVKIADFGMARDIYRADYYRKGGKAMLPIKWMPPEAFLDGIFTSKTDVWSFGVLLWEVISLGYMPYTGCANREVMQLVTSGGRLEPPSNCPGPLYGIMTQCWHPSPDERPTFATILERLDYCMQDPDVMNAPLPVFNRPPSAERDTTIMRPPAHENSCLQVQRTADYLVPLSGPTPDLPSSPSTSSVDKLLNNSDWETSFVMAESRSTQPLLEAETSSSGGSPGKNAAEESLVGSENKAPPNNNNNNNNNQQQNNLKASLSLDPSALIKQPLPYVNVNVTPSHANAAVADTELEQQGRAFTVQAAVSRHLMSDADISC